MEEIQHLSQDFWDQRYVNQQTGWDLGMASPPIQCFFDQVKNKNVSILIPGAGNAHEADYLLKNDFAHITIIDIAPTVVSHLQEKYKNNSSIRIILGDFFEHQGQYDIIVEQTFFCAISPSLRSAYVKKMHELLVEHGFIVGLLFNKDFEGGPPYGGSQLEYEKIFSPLFTLNILTPCHNSVKPREGTELFVKMIKK